jgi:hypothetical protein
MSKKKTGKGKSRNPELRGGTNSLPKKEGGAVDVKKVAEAGAKEQKKKWVDKKVVKDSSTAQKESSPKKPGQSNKLQALRKIKEGNKAPKTPPVPKKQESDYKKSNNAKLVTGKSSPKQPAKEKPSETSKGSKKIKSNISKAKPKPKTVKKPPVKTR